MSEIQIKWTVPNIIYISVSPLLRSTILNIGWCLAGVLILLQYEGHPWLAVTVGAALLALGLSELGESEDVIADRGSGRLVTLRRSWLERLVTHTCQTSVTPLTQVSAVRVLRWAGDGSLTVCLRLRSGGLVSLFRRSFPSTQKARLRAVADQLSEFLGLAGLQSVADWEADSWRHLGDLDPDPDPVTSLDSQSKELHRLLQQKPSTET